MVKIVHFNRNITKNVIICTSVFVTVITILGSFGLFKKQNKLLKKIKEMASVIICYNPLSILRKHKKIVLPPIDKHIETCWSDDEIEKIFSQACQAVRLYRSKLKLEQWLFLYGLYRQSLNKKNRFDVEDDDVDFVLVADEKHTNTSKSKENNFLEKEKKNAIKHCKELSEKECKIMYATYVYSLFPQALGNIDNSDSTIIGTTKCVSKMKNISEENSIENNLCDTFCYHVVEENVEGVKYMLNEHPSLLNEKNSEGLTALHYACDRGYLEIAKMLVEKGASVNVEDSYGETPLDVATEAGQMEIVDYLLTLNAKANTTNDDGQKMKDMLNE